jgi:23S rRNA (adenine2503-C2)-methyltransferase
MKPLLRDINPTDWPALLAQQGFPSYRGRQLAHWLYTRGAMSWDAMHNLPRGVRAALAAIYDASGARIHERQSAPDGTRKLLLQMRDGQDCESVIIPMSRHATFCVSSQIGCAMACSFCATARGGLARNLSCGEIVEQVQILAADLAAAPFARHGERAYNVVFMGMGEPLDNFAAVAQAIRILTDPAGLGLSPQRIQISTSAPPHALEQLAAFELPVGLTISLGGTDDASRRKLMPVAGRAGVAAVLDAAARYAERVDRRATIAWILIAGQTDAPAQALQLAQLVARRPFKVNLIPLNRLDQSALTAPSRERILAFQRVLIDAGVPAFIRASGGQEIDAACGQLRRRRLAKRDSSEAQFH